MLDSKFVTTVTLLLTHSTLSIAEFAIEQQVTKKQAWYEIEQLNKRLAALSLPRVTIKEGHISVPATLKTDWTTIQAQELLLDGEERIHMVILYTYLRQEWVSNAHYQQLLNMSKNSVVLALKRVKSSLSVFDLTLKYSRKEGYVISGPEHDIRRCIDASLNSLRKSPHAGQLLDLIFARWQLPDDKQALREFVMSLAAKYDVRFVNERFEHVIQLLLFIKHGEQQHELVYSPQQLQYIQSVTMQQMAEEVATYLGLTNDRSGNVIFVTAQLLSSLQGKQGLVQEKAFLVLTEAIINEVQRYTLNSFEASQALIDSLYEHLVPCYFRLLFGTPLHNPYVKTIQDEYTDLYELVKKGLRPLEEAVKQPLTADEIAYFTIHFGGQLQLPTETKSIRALAVCPNGVSSSLIMVYQLRLLFPNITFQPVHSVSEVADLAAGTFDLIFSTVHFVTTQPLYVIKPILNPVEKEMLKKQLRHDFNWQPAQAAVNVSDVMSVVQRYASVKDEQALFKALSDLMNLKRQDQGGINLHELVTTDFIQQTEQQLTWQEAIKQAAQPLLVNDYISDGYIEAMITMVEDVGPYIVIAPHVAIPHARPESGSKKLGMSLLQLKHPVDFDLRHEGDDDYQVQLVFVLSAVDSESHLTALKQLSNILEDEETIAELVVAPTIEAIYSIIKTKGSVDND